MSFRSAVETTRALAGHYRDGLQALREADRNRLVCRTPRRLRGSLNLDAALCQLLPNEPRWDYAVAMQVGPAPECVVWIEVHPASSGHVDEVLSKLGWLKQWLNTHSLALRQLPGQYYWIATGNVALRPGGREAKRMAQCGLSFPRRRLDLDNCWSRPISPRSGRT